MKKKARQEVPAISRPGTTKPATKAYARSCSQAASGRYGIDIPWEIIAELVDWLMENCFETEAAFLAVVEDPSRFQMRVLFWRSRRVLRGTFKGRTLRRAANALTDTMLTVAGDTSVEQLGDIFQEAS